MATATDLEIEPQIVEPEKFYEVVDGRIVKELRLGIREIRLASRLVRAINLFDVAGTLGEVVEEALFVLRRSPRLRRRPDIAFICPTRWPLHTPAPQENAWDIVPDLAVEIASPTDRINDIMDKIDEYFAAGVRLVWAIYPKQHKVYAYDSPTSVRILQVSDELDGGPILPGFRMPLANLFETPEDGPPVLA